MCFRMDRLIREDRNKLKYILLILISAGFLLSCGALKKTEKTFRIGIASVYDNDTCNLIINNKVYLKDKPIITNRSLGLDLRNGVSIDAETINIKIAFHAVLDKEMDLERSVKLDTIININKGTNVLITAYYENIKIEQQRPPFIID